MWVFSKTGFVSITNEPGTSSYLVRGRTREDLEDFIRTGSHGRWDSWCDELVATITDTADTRDYRWRVVLPRNEVKRIVSDQLDDIDYDNVKDAIDKDDPKRHNALLDVWSAMMNMQEGGLYNRPALPLTDEQWYERYDGWVDSGDDFDFQT
jgi:hypothetical protein